MRYDHYSGRTASLFVFFSSKCSLFHNSKVFGSCIIHILYTGFAKIKKKNNSGAKRLIDLIESKPCLWDKTSDSYKDKIEKSKSV